MSKSKKAGDGDPKGKDTKPAEAADAKAKAAEPAQADGADDKGDASEGSEPAGEADDGKAGEAEAAKAAEPSKEPHAAAPPQPTEEQQRAAAKKPQATRPSAKERSEAQSREALMKAEIDQLRSQLRTAQKRVKELETEVGHLRIAPGRAIPMSPLEVSEAIKVDKAATFRVLAEYRHMNTAMAAGRTLEARHYPHLLDYVRNGLQIVQVQKQRRAG